MADISDEIEALQELQGQEAWVAEPARLAEDAPKKSRRKPKQAE